MEKVIDTICTSWNFCVTLAQRLRGSDLPSNLGLAGVPAQEKD